MLFSFTLTLFLFISHFILYFSLFYLTVFIMFSPSLTTFTLFVEKSLCSSVSFSLYMCFFLDFNSLRVFILQCQFDAKNWETISFALFLSFVRRKLNIDLQTVNADNFHLIHCFLP